MCQKDMRLEFKVIQMLNKIYFLVSSFEFV